MTSVPCTLESLDFENLLSSLRPITVKEVPKNAGEMIFCGCGDRCSANKVYWCWAQHQDGGSPGWYPFCHLQCITARVSMSRS